MRKTVPSSLRGKTADLSPRQLQELRLFAKKAPDQRGLVLLAGAAAAGSRGTGKTLAAETIATELGRPLQRVDLPQVVGKYIGETEKNLDRLFAEAEATGAVLFFDEADALFGKRTDVKDSHDRFANLEVSYLLQRAESYPGVVILASNQKSNLDSAVLRRFRQVLEIGEPEA